MKYGTLRDRHVKENLRVMDPAEVLEKVAGLPLATWNYKSQPASIRHLGPMVQDFKATFGPGESDMGITRIDGDGVALAGIQGLNQKSEDSSQRAEVRSQKLEAENAALKQALSELRALAEKVNGGEKRRLANPDPAMQSLTFDSASVTWLRGGSSPEVWRTTFECSANGLDWTALGDGTSSTPPVGNQFFRLHRT